MCTDISRHTQHIPCYQFVVWLLVSTSYIGRYQASCTETRIKTESNYRVVGDLHLIALKCIKHVFKCNKAKTSCEMITYVLLLLHDSTVLVGPWPPSRSPSSRLFCVHVSSSLWHPSPSGPPSRRPSTLTLVFLHSYFLLEYSDVTTLPPFPHSSSPHFPAISIFLYYFCYYVQFSI